MRQRLIIQVPRAKPCLVQRTLRTCRSGPERLCMQRQSAAQERCRPDSAGSASPRKARLPDSRRPPLISAGVHAPVLGDDGGCGAVSLALRVGQHQDASLGSVGGHGGGDGHWLRNRICIDSVKRPGAGQAPCVTFTTHIIPPLARTEGWSSFTARLSAARRAMPCTAMNE